MLKKSVAGGIILLFLLISIFPMVSSISSSYTNIIYVDNDRGAYYTKIHYKIENGSLSGFVNDSFFNPIEGTLVSIKCGGLHMQNTSDSNGFYYIDNVPIVDCYWNVSASKKGYETFWVEMSIDINSTYDFVLTPLGKTLYVGGSGPGNYSKIQDAIDNASDDDTVFVYSGLYKENLVINKSIILQGENRNSTIIDVGGNYPIVNQVLIIDVNWTSIKGFTIQNGKYGIHVKDSSNITITDNLISHNIIGISGISLSNSSNNMIVHNIIDSYFDGIFLRDSSKNNTILDNSILNNNEDGIWIQGSSSCNMIIDNYIANNNAYGIVILSQSENTSIFGNTITKSHIGIRLYFNSNNAISNNTIDDNDDGFILKNSSGNVITNNRISNNHNRGLTLNHSHNNSVYKNAIYGNEFEGIWLFFSYYNNFHENIVSDNRRGFELGGYKNSIWNNLIENNSEFGMHYWATCANKIYKNNFINNKEDASFSHIFLIGYSKIYDFFWINNNQLRLTNNPININET